MPGLYPSGYNNIACSTHTLNLHSNNCARKFTLIYTVNSCSRMFYRILKKKQKEKSHDMQKFTPNHSKHDCYVKRNHMTCNNSHPTEVDTIVTSQAQILTQRNYVMERSVQNIHERNYLSKIVTS